MLIEQTHFDLGTGAQDTQVITQAEFNALMGAYVLNDVNVTTRWVYTPDTVDGTSVVTVDVRGRIQYLFCVTQPVTA